MLLALCEVAIAHGIHTMISNYEPHLARIYRKAGAELDQLGKADGYGRRPVCCGAFEVSPRILNQMRAKLEITRPLYERPIKRDASISSLLATADAVSARRAVTTDTPFAA